MYLWCSERERSCCRLAQIGACFAILEIPLVCFFASSCKGLLHGVEILRFVIWRATTRNAANMYGGPAAISNMLRECFKYYDTVNGRMSLSKTWETFPDLYEETWSALGSQRRLESQPHTATGNIWGWNFVAGKHTVICCFTIFRTLYHTKQVSLTWWIDLSCAATKHESFLVTANDRRRSSSCKSRIIPLCIRHLPDVSPHSNMCDLWRFSAFSCSCVVWICHSSPTFSNSFLSNFMFAIPLAAYLQLVRNASTCTMWPCARQQLLPFLILPGYVRAAFANLRPDVYSIAAARLKAGLKQLVEQRSLHSTAQNGNGSSHPTAAAPTLSLASWYDIKELTKKVFSAFNYLPYVVNQVQEPPHLS